MEEGRTTADNEEPLGEEQATKYRAFVARCNYLTLDRRDIAFAVTELVRNMFPPRKGDWVRLKRLGLRGWHAETPTVVYMATNTKRRDSTHRC